jgi:hypothetical protein
MAQAPTNSVVNLNTPAVAPDGFEDPQTKAAVELFLNGMNNILRALEQYGGITQKDVSLWSSLIPTDTLLRHQLGRLYVTAGENINNGDFVNLYLDAGILKARKAQATAGNVRRAAGYCSTSGGILIGARGEVILSLGILTIAGVNPGDLIFLSAVAGQATIVPPVGAGQLEQFLGIGVASNLVYVSITMGQYIQH